MYCHILRVRAIPTYRVYRLYDYVTFLPEKKPSLFTSIGSYWWTFYSVLRLIEISVKFSKHLQEYCVCASKLENRVKMIAAAYMFVGKHQDFLL